METLSRVGAHLDVVGACCGCEEEEGEEGGEEGGVEVWGVHCYLGVVVVAVVEDLGRIWEVMERIYVMDRNRNGRGATSY